MTAIEIYSVFLNLLTNQIREGILPAHLKNISLNPEIRLDELALDSISQAGLLASLSDETDNYFPDSIFFNNPTLWEIAEKASGHFNYE